MNEYYLIQNKKIIDTCKAINYQAAKEIFNLRVYDLSKYEIINAAYIDKYIAEYID